MLSLTSVTASEHDIGDVADEFMLPCQRVHAMTVMVCMAAGFEPVSPVSPAHKPTA